MSSVHVSIDIDAAPKDIWDTVMDPDRLSDWVTIHRSVSNVSSDPDSEGAKMDQVLCMRGMKFKVHWTLAKASAPNEALWEGHGPAGSKASIRYRLSGNGDDDRDGDGPTTFEYTNDFSAPGGPLGSVASRIFVGGASEREAKQSLSRLKALVEKS